MFDNDWIQDDLDMMMERLRQRGAEKRRKQLLYIDYMLKQGFIVCTRCKGSGRISKDEGRILYPRKSIKDKIKRTCPVCQGKAFIKA